MSPRKQYLIVSDDPAQIVRKDAQRLLGSGPGESFTHLFSQAQAFNKRYAGTLFASFAHQTLLRAWESHAAAQLARAREFNDPIAYDGNRMMSHVLQASAALNFAGQEVKDSYRQEIKNLATIADPCLSNNS